ncbi:DNA alkylation repair enzyme [uncultured archaeon]|nr:DNA alkylation repair enzyme [uncultured archaeon]
MLNELTNEIEKSRNPEKAKGYQRFFKTGKGEYGEGDVFLGLTMPQQRAIIKKYTNLSFLELQTLLNSKFHEYRMAALLILNNKYKKAKKDNLEKRKIYEFYMKNTRNINNWDLVDLSAPNIVGDFLIREGTDILKMLAKSDNLWERRIAIISTLQFIRKGKLGETLAISEMLLHDEHDLIHKAVGWALREVGKKNKNVLEIFLASRNKEMPRTMLRYSIEKFSPEERKKWMQK